MFGTESPGQISPEVEFMKAEEGPILTKSVAWRRTWSTCLEEWDSHIPFLGMTGGSQRGEARAKIALHFSQA
jgi:hypothetical protein